MVTVAHLRLILEKFMTTSRFFLEITRPSGEDRLAEEDERLLSYCGIGNCHYELILFAIIKRSNRTLHKDWRVI